MASAAFGIAVFWRLDVALCLMCFFFIYLFIYFFVASTGLCYILFINMYICARTRFNENSKGALSVVSKVVRS